VDATSFDRLVKALVGIVPRRVAVRVAIGTGITGVASRFGLAESAARKKKRKKKKRCRRQGQTCGGKRKCCNKSGLIQCREFPVLDCEDIAGFYCCGLEGAPCDPGFGTPAGPSPTTFGNCSCCGPLFCGEQLDGSFRCQTEDT
jgi:hypothetical protein